MPQYTDFNGTVHYIDSNCTFLRILSAVTRDSRNSMRSLIIEAPINFILLAAGSVNNIMLSS